MNIKPSNAEKQMSFPDMASTVQTTRPDFKVNIIVEKPASELPPMKLQIDNTALTFTSMEKNPSMWDIAPDGNGIVATNSHTGRVFKGAVKEFSRLLHD